MSHRLRSYICYTCRGIFSLYSLFFFFFFPIHSIYNWNFIAIYMRVCLFFLNIRVGEKITIKLFSHYVSPRSPSHWQFYFSLFHQEKILYVERKETYTQFVHIYWVWEREPGRCWCVASRESINPRQRLKLFLARRPVRGISWACTCEAAPINFNGVAKSHDGRFSLYIHQYIHIHIYI